MQIPIMTTTWRFWAFGWYWTRQPGKIPYLTIGLGPLRLSFIGARA